MNAELKKEFITFLETRGEYFRKVHEGQYRIRCPFCGDTQKNFNEGHLYIKAELDNDYAIAYNCFKCGEHGYLNEDLIDRLGFDEGMRERLIKESKTSKRKHANTALITNFDYRLPDVDILPEKLSYIDKRLGINFEKEEYENMKVVTSIYDFLMINEIKTRPSDYVLDTLQKYYVGFVTNGNSHILFRDISDSQKYSWIKYPITEESKMNRVFYTLRQDPLDIFTDEEITINISEGVFDCLGIAHHLKYLGSNTMNVSVTSSQYVPFIMFLIQLGLVGKNITINIFSDNDELFNKDKNKKYYPTSFEYIENKVKKYRPLFKHINLYHNMKKKDYGVHKEDIKLTKKSV